MKLVYDFDEHCDNGRALLGGKGLGLAEMTQLGLPVPRGFTITTEAGRLSDTRGELPAELLLEIDEHLAHLEEITGKRFGDPRRPLLVSVRSGGPISMPGMMETILNLGLNRRIVEELAYRDGNVHLAFDAYRRLIQMYGEVVAGIEAEAFATARDAEPGMAASLRAFERVYEQHTGTPFPQDPHEQLTAAIRSVFASWDAPRAVVYRRQYGISDDLGTAANVVEMVFGNRDERSATGVCFSRNPATGDPGLYGEFLVDAQGEDIVAGTRTPRPIAAMRDEF